MITKLKIARLYFCYQKSQREIARGVGCHYNTIGRIIKKCKIYAPDEAWFYLRTSEKIITEKLQLFKFLESASTKPISNKRSLSDLYEKMIIKKQKKLHYGHKRMFKYLERQGFDTDNIYTPAKIKGVYKRNNLKGKKVRTVNGERRPLYNYNEIEAFEYLQYDTKEIADKHSLPLDIYRKFKYQKTFPKYQWTIIDAKTRTRFLAWSYSRDSYFGFKFLEFVVCWLRAHNVRVKIHAQIDGGGEFCSGSKRKMKDWNRRLVKYGAEVYGTEGVKWKQNLVERSHRTDDEEFYCPRGAFIEKKDDFMVEGQYWIIYYNHRSNSGIGLNGITPKEKLEELGYYNAEEICNFPCLILEDFFNPFKIYFNVRLSPNVLTHYRFHSGYH